MLPINCGLNIAKILSGIGDFWRSFCQSQWSQDSAHRSVRGDWDKYRRIADKCLARPVSAAEKNPVKVQKWRRAAGQPPMASVESVTFIGRLIPEFHKPTINLDGEMIS